MSRQLNGDLFVAGVINQKAINQNTQQILVLVALQLANIIEAQFGFAENDDSDTIAGIGVNVV